MTPVQWAVESRRRQGLPDFLEEESVLAEWADALLEDERDEQADAGG